MLPISYITWALIVKRCSVVMHKIRVYPMQNTGKPAVILCLNVTNLEVRAWYFGKALREIERGGYGNQTQDFTC